MFSSKRPLMPTHPTGKHQWFSYQFPSMALIASYTVNYLQQCVRLPILLTISSVVFLCRNSFKKKISQIILNIDDSAYFKYINLLKKKIHKIHEKI